MHEYSAIQSINVAIKAFLCSQVAGVPMTVLRTSTVFEKKWLATQIHAAAACPILEGKEHVWRRIVKCIHVGSFLFLSAVCVCFFCFFHLCTGSVSITANTISWFLPVHIDPLVSSGQFKLLEVHVGVDGQRLSAAEMAARGFSLSVNNVHAVLEIPVGAVGGYFKVGGTEIYFRSISICMNEVFLTLSCIQLCLDGLKTS